ncbi:MAG TPA: DUF1684 domain-containing protein [Terriglobales bacterium]|nr:DUF1684 domain-containing protein [Terriglobales bacterium]
MRLIPALLLLLVSVPAFATEVNSAAYKKDYAEWTRDYSEHLKKNWLVVVGLSWLREGTNRVGGDPKTDVPLPAGKVPAQAAKIDFRAGKATFTALPGAKFTSDGKPVTTIEMKPDVSGKPTIIETAGSVRFYLIQRGQRYGIRVKDSKSKLLADFKGAQFYPVSQKYVVEAKFVPYDKPKKVMVPTVIGQDAEMDSPGYVEFTLLGQRQHLQALDEGAKELFFIIKDQTSGKATYGAGRFLYSELPKNGKVELDFNRAQNPPCAWTPYATCPLPPKENRMNVAVEAGEKYSGHH